MSTALVISLGAVVMSLFAVFVALRGARSKTRAGGREGSSYGGSDVADCGPGDGGGCDGGGGGGD
jgi:hypothetical protein